MIKRFFNLRYLTLLCVALLIGTGAFYQIASSLNTQKAHASTTNHYLYVVEDGLVSVYDIDNNHAFVKSFTIPEQGKRGVMISPSRGWLYVSYCGATDCGGGHGYLLAYDLIHNAVVWNVSYNFGVDQPAITPDGSKIYMPHGDDSTDGLTSIIDAATGNVLGTISTGANNTGTNGHNTVVSLDGTQAYLTGWTGATDNYIHVVNTATNQYTNVGPVINGVRPFTVNGNHTLIFTTSSNTCGFQVLSLVTHAPLYTVPFSGSCNWGASTAPSHGISLSPDEKRIYVMDAPQDVLEVYDVSGLPATAPQFVATVPLNSLSGYSSPCQTNCEREGWVLNDLSGRYVYVGDTGNVISTSTLQSVMTIPTLQNTRQMIEADWTNGVITATSTHFGIGRVTSSSPTPTPTPPTTPTVPVTPTTVPGSTLGQDTFQRANQSGWGTSSGGQPWTGDAQGSAFSISGNTGKITGNGTAYNAILGASTTDAETLFSGSLSNFSNGNIGAVLRWVDTNDWYKAYINGTQLVIQSRVNGTATTLTSANFTATAGTSYTIRFRVVGTSLYAKVWPTSGTEPTNWMATATNSALTAGAPGLRIQTPSGATASVTSYLATSMSSSTPTPTPTTTPTQTPTSTPTNTPTTTPTMTPTPGSGTIVAQDNFTRANQSYWGTASDGLPWAGDAATNSAFSILNNAGSIKGTNGIPYNATLGPTLTDSEVLFSGSISSFNNSNFGAVLRWTDTNDWYKAYIDGTSLIIQKKVNGTNATLMSTAFPATAGTVYSIRFRVVGTTLYAKAWQAGTSEPANWTLTTTDTSLSSGYDGLRIQLQSGYTANVPNFVAVQLA